MTEAPIPSVAVAQTDLLCVSCGGQCRYTPQSGALSCHSCGTAHAIAVDPDADPAREQQYDPSLKHTEQPRITQERPYQCQTCGGEVVFHGASISEACAYCNGALVERLPDEAYDALGVIPFALPEAEAQARAERWVAERWAAPGDLKEIVAQGRVLGIYVPFWTFDSQELVNYTVRYRVKSGKRTYNRAHSDTMNTAFDDLLAPASPHVTPLIRDGILHDFDPERLRPFDPAYLAGFAAERHHQSVREGLEHNAADKRLLMRNRIKTHSGKSRIYDVSYKTDTTGITYRRILLPVWILHYEYEGEAMKVVTCGLQGRTFGERPFSMAKLTTMAALASAAVAAFGFLWGAAQIY